MRVISGSESPEVKPFQMKMTKLAPSRIKSKIGKTLLRRNSARFLVEVGLELSAWLESPLRKNSSKPQSSVELVYLYWVSSDL